MITPPFGGIDTPDSHYIQGGQRMNDKTYYDYLNLVDHFVRKWAEPDAYLHTIIEELIEDARSYAYLHYMEVHAKFPGEPDQANRYYHATVRYKLDTYLNYYYKGQVQRRINGKMTRWAPPQAVYLDAPVERDTENNNGSILDTALFHGLPQLVTMPETPTFTGKHQEILTKYQLECTGRTREVVKLALKNALRYLDNHPDKPVSRSSGAFDFLSIGNQVGIKPLSANNIWMKYRKEFLERHPEVLDIIRQKDVER